MKEKKERTELGKVLKKFREERGFTIRKLAEISGVGNGTIGDIESGKSNGSRKTLNILSDVLRLSKDERNILDSAFLGRKVMPSDDPRVQNMSKSKRLELDDFLKDAVLFFQNESISDEDKQKLFDSLQEAFFEIKLANKRKK